MAFELMVLDSTTQADLVAIEKLYSELDHLPQKPIKPRVAAILSNLASQLLIARNHESELVAMTVINIVYKIAAIEARIDDVVVDESMRGHGLGQALMERAIELCWEAGADKIELTSRPTREAANHLYQKLGFTLRETNVYQLKRAK